MMDKLYQLRNPRLITFSCPRCGGEVPYFDVKIGFGEKWTQESFECPSCKFLLCVSRKYAWSVFCSCSLLAVAVPVLLGVSPWYLLIIAVFILVVLFASLAGAYAKVLFPPRILIYFPHDLSLLGPRQKNSGRPDEKEFHV